MITSLTIKNVASYDQDGIQLADLKKINFIYGSNGSGKTTITKLIAGGVGPDFRDCLIKWQDENSLKPLVYNKDFRDANFGKGKIDGVFTLGKASKQQAEEIEAKEVRKKEITDRGKAQKDVKEKTERQRADNDDTFRDTVWVEIYKRHERDFKEAFKGHMGSKQTFKAKVLDEYENNKGTIYSLEQLVERSETIFGTAPLSMQPILTPSAVNITEIETNTIWSRKIIGKADVDIASLIRRLGIDDWVNEGKQYLTDDNTCPFCQAESITPDFRGQLEKYFDETFVSDVALVKSLAETYSQEVLNMINQLQQILNVESQNSSTKLRIDKFTAYLETLKSQFRSNEELINSKIKEPSRPVGLVSTKEQLTLITKLLDEANLEIRKHNTIVENFTNERSRLVSDIWKYIVNTHEEVIKPFIDKQANLNKAIEGMEASLEKNRQLVRELIKELKELKTAVTGVESSIIEINQTLKAFGFHNFSIVPYEEEPNKYQIKREDGTLAENSMSEGEITFLTFLYFMQLAKGSLNENDISDDRILVIDDPISSLDSNILFIVSALLKQTIKKILSKSVPCNIKQLILLTHNVYFHKEASFIDGRAQPHEDRAFWVLRKNKNITKVQCYNDENPITNSYQLLWKELQNRDHNSDVTLQNTMRRIIENYFRILGGMRDEQLLEKFTDLSERQICLSLLCWINDGSHSIPDDLYLEHPNDTTERYLAVFEKIFEHSNHKSHYNMMMGISA